MEYLTNERLMSNLLMDALDRLLHGNERGGGGGGGRDRGSGGGYGRGGGGGNGRGRSGGDGRVGSGREEYNDINGIMILEEATDYIQALETQVVVMKRLSDLLAGRENAPKQEVDDNGGGGGGGDGGEGGGSSGNSGGGRNNRDADGSGRRNGGGDRRRGGGRNSKISFKEKGGYDNRTGKRPTNGKDYPVGRLGGSPGWMIRKRPIF